MGHLLSSLLTRHCPRHTTPIMPSPGLQSSLVTQLSRMSLSASAAARPRLLTHANTTTTTTTNTRIPQYLAPSLKTQTTQTRLFTTTPRHLNWLMPKTPESSKSRKGRCRVPTGGSMRGTTVVWGDYGLRLLDHDRRISAQKFKIAEDTIKKRLRGMKYRFYTRIAANIGVYKSGNESRMGKGKGGFDHWASRVAVSKVVFEVKGELHEQVVRDAFRLAGNKLPGQWEFVKRGDPPVMGVTKIGLHGVTEADLKRPRKKLPLEESAATLPATTPSSSAAPSASL